MRNIKIFFIFFLLYNSVLSLLCINSIFDPIFINDLKSFKVGPKKEICYKYKLTRLKNKISLTFSLAKSYTAEVVIYKSLYQMEKENGKYINSYEEYLVAEYPFKEIDVRDFDEYVYIIIRDKKNYFFNDHIILYDSEVPINLIENNPFEISNFMSNNKYILTFSSNESLQFVYATKIKSKKLITILYNGNLILDKKIDDSDIILNLRNEDNLEKLLTIYVENKDDNFKDKYFSIIVYEKEIDELINIEKDKSKKIFYIKNDFVQNFFFYADISNYTESSSINFKLDYISKKNNYTNINSFLIYSNDSINSENFINTFYQKNLKEYCYIHNSDEYYRLYFKDEYIKNIYKYIIIKLEINNYIEYYSPKYFTISLSKELQEINIINMSYYKTQIITKSIKSYIPVYYKFLLDKNTKYIFATPYQDYVLLRKGDLLINSKINQNYLYNEKDIIILSEIKELTVEIFGNEFEDIIFYIEKINQKDVIIIENERNNNEISINISPNEKKYILGTYNRDVYEDGAFKATKYWMAKQGEIDLYYKNTISVEVQSLFPTLEKNKKFPEIPFILNNHIDLFTITCSKPGILLLKPIMKTFNEKTHIIGQNSISTISLTSKKEIIQLTSPIKSISDFLYLSILPLNGNITLSPDTPGVIEEVNIKENELFTKIIDIKKYKSDELALKILTDNLIDLEIIEIIHYNFSEYVEIKNNKKYCLKKNNFVKFIDINIKQLKIKINGLEHIPIYFGIVKLSTNNIDYIPLAYNFKNDIIKINSSFDEFIEINNKYYGKRDINKNYTAFIFSIQSSKTNYYYNIQIEEIQDKKEYSVFAITLIIILSGIILLSAFVIILIFKKRRGLNIENIKDNHSLLPKQKYILNDLMEINE